MFQPVAHWAEECEVLRKEEITRYVQHTRGRLDTHTDVSIHRRLYESGRIVGTGEESNDTLDTVERLLDCNGEMFTPMHT
jgi:hypothetical protein